jgi:hypothetical protein
MKKKIIRYTIEEPCHEDWNQMQPEAKGRFCSSCSKTVIDFSSMSDFSIVSYLEGKKKESVCGRFRPDQMEKAYVLSKPHPAFSFDLKAVALGLALTTFSAIHTDAQVTPIDTSQVIYQEPLDGLVSAIEYYDHRDEKFTSGTILVDGIARAAVKVQLLDADGNQLSKAVSDEKERFNIPLDWTKNPFSIYFSGPGVISSERKLYEYESITNFEILLLNEETLILGKVRYQE